MQKAGVLAKEMMCACGSAMNMNSFEQSSDKMCWRCPRKYCKKRKSIRESSYFQNHNLPLGTLFLIIFFIFKFPKMLSKYIAEIVSTSEQTLVQWGCFIRESISHYFLENSIILGTLNPVQIDESMFGGKCKYHRGSHHKHMKSWVFGIVEEATNRNVMWTVNSRNADTLTSIISDHVVPGATIKSDEWGAYTGLTEEGFNHLTVNHSINYVNENEIHTQLIESVWSQIKSSLKNKRGTTKGNLQGYLDFYSFNCEANFEDMTPTDKFLEIIQVGKFY